MEEMKFRLKFWTWVHERAEDFWHWVWINKVQPLMPPLRRNDLYYGPGTFTVMSSGGTLCSVEVVRNGSAIGKKLDPEVDRIDIYRQVGDDYVLMGSEQTSGTLQEDTVSLNDSSPETGTVDDHTPKD